MDYDVTIRNTSKSVKVRSHPSSGWLVSVDGGEERHWEGGPLGPAEWLLRSESKTISGGVGIDGDRALVQLNGYPITADVVDIRSMSAFSGGLEGDAGRIESAIPGAVVRIVVSEGDEVSVGQVLLVVEAMKMENEFKAPFDGVVEAISVAVGDTVSGGDLLMNIVELEA